VTPPERRTWARRAAGTLGLFALASLAACVSSPPVARTGVSGSAMIQRLDLGEKLAGAGETDPSPERMDAVRDALGLPAALALPGRTVIVAKDPFLDRLDGKRAEQFREAGARIRDLRSSLTQALAGLVSAAVRNLVRYSGWRTLLEWAVVLAVAALLVRQLARGRFVPERTIDESGGQRRRRTERTDWVREAETAVARGDVDAAVRGFYRALLSALAARGLVRDDPALTAGECRVAVGSVRPGLYPVVAEATGAFERVVYGETPGRMGDVDALRRAERAARAA